MDATTQGKEPILSSPPRASSPNANGSDNAAVRPRSLLDAAEYPTNHHLREDSSSFRSLLQSVVDSAAPPPEDEAAAAAAAARSPPPVTRKTRESPAHHQKEDSLGSASSFKSALREDEPDDPTAAASTYPTTKENSFGSPTKKEGGMAVASVLRPPVGAAEGAAEANRMVTSGTAAAEVKGKAGGRGGRVVRKPEELPRVVGWLRLLTLVLSMVSFSIMAADKTKGWAGDSFDRYREFRYCLSVNVIVFIYSLFQVYVQIHHMSKKQRVMSRPISYFFDFTMDQILAYLLMSASSAAASRNAGWVSSFGSDKFTKNIDGSIAMSFLAFFALALSSLISAYKLFGWNY